MSAKNSGDIRGGCLIWSLGFCVLAYIIVVILLEG